MNRAWARRRASQRVRILIRRGYSTRASRRHTLLIWKSLGGGLKYGGV